jgi:anthranilate synthase/aminodeoxychorismate synthase-like glutamine amidotransferase
MTVLVIDNYDSFVYNLVQYVGEFDPEVVVRRNDALDLQDVRDLDPDGVVVSPGPGTPREAGISIPLFAETDYPILGVCLGHQALCAAAGAPVGHAPEVVQRQTLDRDPRRNWHLRASARPLRGGSLPLAGGRRQRPARLPRNRRVDDLRAGNRWRSRC